MKKVTGKKALTFGILIGLLVCFLCSCQSRRRSEAGAEEEQITADQMQEEGKDTEVAFTGIVKKIDTEINSVEVFDIKEKQEYQFNYTGATDIRDQYDQLLTMPEVQVGEIVDCTFRPAPQKLLTFAVSKNAWTYGKAGNLVTNSSKRRMKIADRNYWYDEGLLLFSEGEPVELNDLHPEDELSIKGVGSQICSITVTKGHGYIRLLNYADFVGGMIEVGRGIIRPVVKNMILVVREGNYQINIENGELQAQKEVTLKRGEEEVLDLSGYHMEPERVGFVRFDIEPYGADLYINGTKRDYAEPVKLNYGEHSVEVKMNGYNDFKGILTIAESTPTISINLAEGTYEVEEEASQSGGEPEDEPDTSIEQTEDGGEEPEEEEEAGTTAVDEEHTITVESPAGASLYLNGELKGEIPLTFTKEIGNHTIILSQPGYLTKSYSVEVIDDGENPVLNFPDMIKSE